MIDNFYYYYYFFSFLQCYCTSDYLSVRILFCITFHCNFIVLVLVASILVGEEPPLWIHY